MGKKQNRLVKKSNALIRSYWPINSVWEPRLVALVASKIRVDDEDFKTYKIPVSELVDESGQKRGGLIYSEIRKVVRSLMGRVIEINDDPKRDKFYALFSACEIDKEAGIIEVEFHAKLKPHYLELQKQFTLYSLEEFMRLPSAYSQRLFEILTSWKNISGGEITISMDELHNQLDTPKSQRKNFNQFKLYVLDQAQKDIMANPDSSLDYEWQAVKEGRKVVAVRFIFDRNKVAAEREALEREAQRLQRKRNNQLTSLSAKCFGEMATISAEEQARRPLPDDPEVCDICRKYNLPIPNCQRWVRAEIVE